jgi:PKD repeat protein
VQKDIFFVCLFRDLKRRKMKKNSFVLSIALYIFAASLIMQPLGYADEGDPGDLGPFFERMGLGHLWPDAVSVVCDELSPGSAIRVDPVHKWIEVKQNDMGEAYIEIPVDGRTIKEVSADFMLLDDHRILREGGPGLYTQFGTRSQNIAFIHYGNIIQHFGSDATGYPKDRWSLNKWYTIKMVFHYEAIDIFIFDDQGKLIHNPHCPFIQGGSYDEWHGPGTIKLMGVMRSGLEDDGILRRVLIDNLLIAEERKNTIKPVLNSRSVYRRDEEDKILAISLTNFKNTARTLDITMHIDGLFQEEYNDQQFTPFETRSYQFGISPGKLKSGDYNVTIDIKAADGDDEILYIPLYIKKVPNPQRLEYLSWSGLGDDFLGPAREHGFTVIKERNLNEDKLDKALEYNLNRGYYLPATGVYDAYIREIEGDGFTEHLTILENGETNIPDPGGDPRSFINPFYEDYLNWAESSIASLVAPLNGHPGFTYMLINSEQKDGPIGYNAEFVDLAQEYGVLGLEEGIPEGFLTLIKGTSRLYPGHLAVSQPVDGIIEDDNVHYNVWKWWKHNGAQNPVHTAVSRGIKSVNPDLELTVEFGQRDAGWLEGWWRTAGAEQTDPTFLNGYINNMIASAKRYGHKISATFQFVIAYEEDIPLCPDVFRESAWATFAKRPDRMGHWGANRCFNADPEYPVESEETKAELRSLYENLYRPFYPMVKQLNQTEKDTALLKSEANWLYFPVPSQLYDHHHFGSGVYIKRRERALTLAGVEWDNIDDDDVITGRLSEYRYLIIMMIDVLPRGVYNAIADFTNNGGIVLADNMFFDTFSPNFTSAPTMNMENLYTINDDYSLIIGNYWKIPDPIDPYVDYETRRQYQYRIGEIRDAMGEAGLESYATAHFVTSHDPPLDTVVPDDIIVSAAIVNTLERSGVKYVFVINDRRVKGNTGQDRGIAQTVNLTLKESESPVGQPDKTVYDVVSGGEISYTRTDADHIEFPVYLGPGEGRLFAICLRELSAISIDAPPAAEPGENFNITICVNDTEGSAPGSQPIRVSIKGPNQEELDESDYYGTSDGIYELPVLTPLNIVQGVWTITVTELMSGTEESAAILLQSAVSNNPPVLYPFGLQQGTEGEWFVISKVIATDADGDTLTITGENLASGMRFFQTESRSGYVEYKLRWPARFVKEGTYAVIFTASDGNGGTDSEIVTITIDSPATNRTPTLFPIGTFNGNEGEWFAIPRIVATDPDGDDLTITITDFLPGMRFFKTDSRAGYVEYKLRWPARWVTQGTHIVTFTVDDGKGGTDTKQGTIIINDSGNQNPVLLSIGNYTGQEGQWFVIAKVIGLAHDGDTLTITADNLPSGMRFFKTASQPGYVEYKLRWPDRFVKEGTYTVTFMVTDSGGLTDSEEVVITIDNNNAINIAPYVDVAGNPYIAYGFRITDDDNGTGVVSLGSPLFYTYDLEEPGPTLEMKWDDPLPVQSLAWTLGTSDGEIWADTTGNGTFDLQLISWHGTTADSIWRAEEWPAYKTYTPGDAVSCFAIQFRQTHIPEPCTVTIADPAVVTTAVTDYADLSSCRFSTTGTLPTDQERGYDLRNKTYWMHRIGPNTYHIYNNLANAQAGGAEGRVITTGSQDGTHSIKVGIFKNSIGFREVQVFVNETDIPDGLIPDRTLEQGVPLMSAGSTLALPAKPTESERVNFVEVESWMWNALGWIGAGMPDLSSWSGFQYFLTELLAPFNVDGVTIMPIRTHEEGYRRYSLIPTEYDLNPGAVDALTPFVEAMHAEGYVVGVREHGSAAYGTDGKNVRWGMNWEEKTAYMAGYSSELAATGVDFISLSLDEEGLHSGTIHRAADVSSRFATTTAAIKAVNPDCKTYSMFGSGYENMGFTPYINNGCEIDILARDSGIDYLGVQAGYHDAGDSIGHWFVAMDASRIIGANRAGNGFILACPPWNDSTPGAGYGPVFNLQCPPSHFSGKQLSWAFHGVKTGGYWRLSDYLNIWQISNGEYPKTYIAQGNGMLNTLDAWGGDTATTPKSIALVYSSISANQCFVQRVAPHSNGLLDGLESQRGYVAEKAVQECLLKGGYPFDAIPLDQADWELFPDLTEYDLIIIPYCTNISDESVSALQAAIDAGKKIILVDPHEAGTRDLRWKIPGQWPGDFGDPRNSPFPEWIASGSCIPLTSEYVKGVTNDFRNELLSIVNVELGDSRPTYLNAYGDDIELALLEKDSHTKFLLVTNWANHSVTVDVGVNVPEDVHYTMIGRNLVDLRQCQISGSTALTAAQLAKFRIQLDADESKIFYISPVTPLVLHPIGPTTGTEGEWFVIPKIIATDTDGDTLTITAEGLQSGMRFFQTESRSGYVEYKLRWVDRFVTAGTYTITFTVSDGNGGTDSKQATITITR